MRLPTFYELFLIPNWGIDSFIAKVRDIKFKAKVDDADIEKLTDDRKKLIENESKLLEDHRKKNKEILAENGGYPPTQNGDIRSLFWLFSLMALQN